MAEIRFNPTIVTQDAAWVGESLNYNTLMPHGALINPIGIEAIDKATLEVKTAIAANDKKIELKNKINNGAGIPSGMTLTFGATSVITSRWASSDATTLEIFPSPGVIAADTSYNYPGYGARPLYSGWAVGRTFAERDAGTPFTLAADTDDEIYLIAFDVPDALRNQEIVLVRHQTRVKENRLPKFSTYSSGLQTKLRAAYQMYIGT
ncbi:hypothetical protein [Brasilonema sp. UFV-L1]|uniref:hypothetical protein n=1 Tax=Brasilonema sp. UFV-L1 TaxID=2234130 RepID=UPI00145FB85D|nr:hypothetical protein [Brasilonema sp. UFV-L1]NMG11135.1 hypothetical protein [Brasilonema sp. UFV-L1]